MTRIKESGSEKMVIDAVRKRTNYDRRLVKDIYFTIFETIQDTLLQEGCCRIPFGRFAVVANNYHCDQAHLLAGKHRPTRLMFRADQSFKSYFLNKGDT